MACSSQCRKWDVCTLHRRWMKLDISLSMTPPPDLVVTALELQGESAIPLISYLRHTLEITAPIFVIAKQLETVALIALSRLDVAGCLLWDDVSSGNLQPCLKLMLDGGILLGSRMSGDLLMTLLEKQGHRAAKPADLTDRQIRLLKIWNERGNPTRAELASQLRVSRATVERDIVDLCDKLGAGSDYTIGVQATIRGYLP